ncbi:MAG: tRNA (guanosine(46)-N7)-methyltransferase TrmB [Ruminococcaceae bacterium]|nr:tRNA (guanosine(46)-N7)-methyltransferase TrmB [Oscillospiraceae bacterium]
MRIRKKKWAQPELDACNFYVNNPAELKGKWADFFAVKRPLELEVGCGKGTFVAEKALRNPDINFIAMDIKSDMLGVGRRNIVKRFEEAGKTVDNIALVAHNVDRIFEVISEDDKIDRIYINFCNPWPRGKHNKRRLTHNTKLELYKSFLKKGGEIHFKTDNDELFDDSLVYFEESGYELKKVVRDLHHSDVEGNIVTEHEKMFSDEGILIKYLVAVLP